MTGAGESTPRLPAHLRCEAAEAEAALAPIIEIHGLKGTLLGAGRLFAEGVVIPTALLLGLLHVVGLRTALVAAVSWCVTIVAVRFVAHRRVPATLLVCAVMVTGKAVLTIASSTLLAYVLQPIFASGLMALVFVGSAVIGRPITERLARDFVHISGHVLERRAVRRMFTHVALVWGASRLLDAGMSLGFLHWGVDAGLLSRALFSPVLTVVTIAACAMLGWRALHRDGVRILLRPAAAAA
jgi:hypothetical protein